MKTIVVYRSKTGYTKRYAEWIAQELNCDIKENASLNDIKDYDIIICGGGLYAGGHNGGKLILKNYDKLKDKKLVMFAVGACPGEDKDIIPLWERLLKDKKDDIYHFYLRGGFDYSRLNAADKLLMNMLKKRLESLENPIEDDKGMLAAYDVPFDSVKRENIMKLVECVRKL